MRFAAFASALVFSLAPPVLAAKAVDFTYIQTPSGNIHCQFFDDMGGSIDCEIIEITATEGLPPRPDDCDLGYGSRFAMEAEGEARLLCYGDTVRNPDGAQIPYGGSFSLYGITCDSAQTGLTCTNQSGHGFRLSKARQELF